MFESLVSYKRYQTISEALNIDNPFESLVSYKRYQTPL